MRRETTWTWARSRQLSHPRDLLDLVEQAEHVERLRCEAQLEGQAELGEIR